MSPHKQAGRQTAGPPFQLTVPGLEANPGHGKVWLVDQAEGWGDPWLPSISLQEQLCDLQADLFPSQVNLLRPRQGQ